ncbi:GM23413 [Drosophila sechellia]|uniref:GM23413 n=1 Tax=Drosophila sechellia TaxID=7238 RepID=B4IPR8_DROSE|nr:GM23413 [Drosophila sechellia]
MLIEYFQKMAPYSRHIAMRMKGVPEELRLAASRTSYPHTSSAPVEVPPEVDQAAELAGHLCGMAPHVD